MLLLGLDFETQGLDPKQHRVIEIGAVLWDVERKTPVSMMSRLVYAPDFAPLTQESTDITGITQADLENHGMTPINAFIEFFGLLGLADAVVAHNGNAFDKLFFLEECKRLDFNPERVARPWIDTSVDMPYSPKIQTRKLTHLAAEHGFLNPFAHRALFDVLTMMRIFSHYDAPTVLALSQEPSVKLIADTKGPWLDGGASTSAAKARGYRWDPISKVWFKSVKKSQVAGECEHREFIVKVEASA